MTVQVAEQTLAEVVEYVLETMAFVCVLPGAGSDDSEAACARASVRFDGPCRGLVSFRVPLAVLPELVSNMLGRQSSRGLSLEQLQDGAGELANVMCGNLLRALAGPERVFVRHAPDVVMGTAAPLAAASVRVQLDEGWAELGVTIEEDDLACGSGG